MTGFIYAIESGSAVKIGYAADPVRRLSELNVGSPDTHRLIGFVAGTKEIERELHGSLRRWRVRGEWFSKDGAVLAFIDTLSPFVAPARRAAFKCRRQDEVSSPGLMERELRSHLLHLATTYSDATGVSPATIGKRAINDNTFFQRLEAEAGFTVKTFDRVVGWLSDSWPECVVWPSDIPRPRVHAHEGDAA